MTGITQYAGKSFLNHLTGGVAIFPLPQVYLALFTAVGSDTGSGFTEPSGGSYARVQLSGNALTNAATPIGNNTLNFASVPAWITAGMYVYDVSTVGAIPVGSTVVSVTGTTVVLNNNATGIGVVSGDQIIFTAFNPATGLSPVSISNAAGIVFPAPTALWGTVLAWGLWDHLAAGNLLTWDYLGAYDWLPVEVSFASPAVLTAKNHGYSSLDSFVYSIEYGGITPVFGAGTFTGFLTVQSPTTDTFTAKNGATVVNTLTSGSGMVRKLTPQNIDIGPPVQFVGGSPGGFILKMA